LEAPTPGGQAQLQAEGRALADPRNRSGQMLARLKTRNFRITPQGHDRWGPGSARRQYRGAPGHVSRSPGRGYPAGDLQLN